MTEENPNTKKQSLRERCNFDNILISIIFFGGGAMLVLAVILFVNVLLILGGKSGDLYESVRNLILSMGGVGAAIGLWFADRRQKALSKQVQGQSEQVQVLSRQVHVQMDQDFNDRLGRGVELLADENVVMRSAGVRVLVDLASNANEEQKSLVANIIYDFSINKARIQYDDNNQPLSLNEKESRQDVQNALDFLISLSLDEQEKLLPNRLMEYKLNLRDLDFSYLNFIDKKLENIDLSQTIIKNVNFSHATIEGVNFSRAIIKNSIFSDTTIANTRFGMEYDRYSLTRTFENLPPKAIIFKCDFNDAYINDTTFCNVKIESSNFFDIDLFGSGGFYDVEFWEGGFSYKNIIGISSDSDLPYFIGTDLGDSEFQFANALEPDKFFELCYAPTNEQQDDITNFIDESRIYRAIDFPTKVFVISDKSGEPWNKPWSGQPVREWVAVECAKKKLKQVEDGLPFESSPQDVDEAKAKVYDAEGLLFSAQEFLPLPEAHPFTRKPKPKKPKPTPKNK